MTRLAVLLLAATLTLFAQDESAGREQADLNRALSEAGSSSIEFVRALENHLKKYPSSPKVAELERAIAKAAIENKDAQRIAEYGERVLAREPEEIQILDAVTRALVAQDDKRTAGRALAHATKYEELIRRLLQEKSPGRMSDAEWRQQVERGIGKALQFQARATGVLGRPAEAINLARRAYDAYPTPESAREMARWLIEGGKNEEAIHRLADAFSLADGRSQEAAEDRKRMGELYRKWKGSEQGLGDLILEAYDRTSALVAGRRAQLLAGDPNAGAKGILDFTLSALSGPPLKLDTLRGKTIVFDFWATWCGPCRVQHPLFDQVKERFKNSPDVVFLSVSTDEDRDAVGPFLKANNWNHPVYFEDGLSRSFQISSIPTTFVVNKRGEVSARMNGFVPDRFVEMLSERIEQAK